MKNRKVIRIDEDKCDGCGLCVPSCAEGAIAIVDGKARLVSETYCDGLGACLKECPRGAITIEERAAAAFDAAAVERHLGPKGKIGDERKEEKYAACPGSLSRALRPAINADAPRTDMSVGGSVSYLANWPIQLKLAPVRAPYFDGARLLIAADCAPFALADFHGSLLNGRVLLIGCPKLDDVGLYLEKLTAIFSENNLISVEIAFMEVPCCFGLVQLVKEAMAGSGKEIPLGFCRVSIKGEIMDNQKIEISGGIK